MLFRSIKKNTELNKLDDNQVKTSEEEANKFMQQNFHEFDFIDIDPFGTPTPFLDNAIMTIKKDGKLGITATDTAPLCGVYPRACYRKYNATPLRSKFCHETALRILIGHIARTAGKYSKGLEIQLSYYQEHYLRTYLKITKGKEKANKTLENIGYIYYCKKCLQREHEKTKLPSEKKCSNCGVKYTVSGPLWLGKINDKKFVKRVLEKSAYLENTKLDKLLTMLIEETDTPFYYDTHKVAKELKIELKTIEHIIENLKKQGYHATRTHFSPTSIKTDANIKDIKKAFS